MLGFDKSRACVPRCLPNFRPSLTVSWVDTALARFARALSLYLSTGKSDGQQTLSRSPGSTCCIALRASKPEVTRCTAVKSVNKACPRACPVGTWRPAWQLGAEGDRIGAAKVSASLTRPRMSDCGKPRR